MVDSKTAGMKRAGGRDKSIKGRTIGGSGNFLATGQWEKYPKMTLGQLGSGMPNQEENTDRKKTMEKRTSRMKSYC